MNEFVAARILEGVCDDLLALRDRLHCVVESTGFSPELKTIAGTIRTSLEGHIEDFENAVSGMEV